MNAFGSYCEEPMMGPCYEMTEMSDEEYEQYLYDMASAEAQQQYSEDGEMPMAVYEMYC